MAFPRAETVRDFVASTPIANVRDGRAIIRASAVSWGAIAAGAAVAAGLSLVLLLLGAGLGVSSVSPWSDGGVGAGSIGASTIVWLMVTQVMAAGVGGYLAGRLRTTWLGMHRRDVYFHDTAHGVVAWSVASLTTAALLASAIGALLNPGVQAYVRLRAVGLPRRRRCRYGRSHARARSCGCSRAFPFRSSSAACGS